ncbi:hypothetical protein BDP55DRAFT_266757 [Colletotrichum godetiae]|uniref:Alpha-carbonic anhydrase domain-containing protein n=1 Tax=Colletotrichum godetiae TaxID=1209918 RepID=A0AAJ0AWB5_9PEZI|nr:uncharacterized protein BDP55DRAFT_266757 [Colletotrichum godetiae]KAK1691515.1 hypothetical protein BDP55DRAFT_266757 [Colletotrichum godetiae]
MHLQHGIVSFSLSITTPARGLPVVSSVRHIDQVSSPSIPSAEETTYRLPITNCHLPSLLCNTSHFSLLPPTRGRRQHIPPPSSSLCSPPCRQ